MPVRSLVPRESFISSGFEKIVASLDGDPSEYSHELYGMEEEILNIHGIRAQFAIPLVSA
jgi:hypothetical protein